MLEVYHYPICPISRKLRIVLREKGIEFELFVEKYWERRVEFLMMNPRGETPVIKTSDNIIIYGNHAIFAFLDEAFPQSNLIGEDTRKRAEVRKISEWFDEKFYHEVTRYIIMEKIIKPMQRNSSAPNSEFVRAAKRNLNHHISYIQHLLDRNAYLAGDKLSMADFSAAAQLSVLDFVADVPWDKSEEMKSWYALIKSRPSFRSILHDIAPGITPPEHYGNPDF